MSQRLGERIRRSKHLDRRSGERLCSFGELAVESDECVAAACRRQVDGVREVHAFLMPIQRLRDYVGRFEGHSSQTSQGTQSAVHIGLRKAICTAKYPLGLEQNR